MVVVTVTEVLFVAKVIVFVIGLVITLVDVYTEDSCVVDIVLLTVDSAW